MHQSVSRLVQVQHMLSTVKGATPQGAELKALLDTPCNHMARLVRDLCEPSAVRENLKDVLKFIKDVRNLNPSSRICPLSHCPSGGDRCNAILMLFCTPHCHCQIGTMHIFHDCPVVLR